jgi:glycogen debranching enzyme
MSGRGVQEVIRLEDQHYILATSSRIVERTFVLKHDDTFALFGPRGDMATIGTSSQGLYHDGTRYLSKLELRLNDTRPVLLGSTTRHDNHSFGADMTNPDVVAGGIVVLPRDLLHMFRSRFVWDRTCYERLRLMNYGPSPLSVRLVFEFEADFADIFEVRGTPRSMRGTLLPAQVGRQFVALPYRGIDGAIRTTRLTWDVQPAALSEGEAAIEIELRPHQSAALGLTIECLDSTVTNAAMTCDKAMAALIRRDEARMREYARVETSSGRFNEWIAQSAADLRMMTTDLPEGPYPYAGVPWFSTVFGRDGIITALATLWISPSLAAGVLRHLAATQATSVVPEQDAEPGKILHESRGGEMAALGEVPFGRYYGSVDSTPLFVVLAGLYYRRTGDRALIEAIWPNIERALEWINRYGDKDGDGFVEYARQSDNGLVQQGWKDSQDSVFHPDGTLAPPPIALCEVQGYVFDARNLAAHLAQELGKHEQARELRESAERLRERFEREFWCEDLGTYAIALDGDKRPCRVRASNAGHCLFSGIASPERARRVAEGLCNVDLFSGWGVRTLAATEARFNPMSYHNGSVWPHDNGILAAGCSRYGLTDIAALIASALFDASTETPLQRLPELFCGFRRRNGEPPTPYPVACAPQAWASATVFMLLQACLGLSIDAVAKRVAVQHARLPQGLDRVTVDGLQVTPGSSIDLQLDRRGSDVSLTVVRRDPDIEVNIVK